MSVGLRWDTALDYALQALPLVSGRAGWPPALDPCRGILLARTKRESWSAPDCQQTAPQHRSTAQHRSHKSHHVSKVEALLWRLTRCLSLSRPSLFVCSALLFLPLYYCAPSHSTPARVIRFAHGRSAELHTRLTYHASNRLQAFETTTTAASMSTVTTTFADLENYVP